MQNNLVVIRSGKIAFSPYFYKPNGFLMKFSLSTFLVNKDESGFHLNIPLRMEGLMATMNYKKGAKGYIDGIVKPGGYIVSIGRHNTTEYIYEDSEFTGLELPVDYSDSFYVKSPDYGIESAATAACHVYTNVEDIYKAAMNASINTYPAFYTGYIYDIQQGIDKLNTLWKSGKEKEIKKQARKLDTGLDNTTAEYLGLTFHTR